MKDCPGCGKILECKKEKEIYVCHNCMEIYRNRGYGFEMYEKLGSAIISFSKNIYQALYKTNRYYTKRD